MRAKIKYYDRSQSLMVRCTSPFHKFWVGNVVGRWIRPLPQCAATSVRRWLQSDRSSTPIRLQFDRATIIRRSTLRP